MPEPMSYSIDHTTSTAQIILGDTRFIVNTQGKGLIDKPKSIDIGLADLKQFCLVPTISEQNLKPRVGADFGLADFSYDSEFIFSYLQNGKLEKKRLFVNSRDQSFAAILAELGRERPDASLLHLDPAVAQKEIGTVSAAKTVLVLVCLMVGIPVLIAIIYIVSLVLRGK